TPALKMLRSTFVYLLATSLQCGLIYMLYKNQTRSITASDVDKQDTPALSHDQLMVAAFHQKRQFVVHEQEFQPMVIPFSRNESFDYKSAMQKLNDEKVSADDPRLIRLIRDYYIDPPSTEKYNLDNPDSLEYSVGQTPFEGGFYIECGGLDGERGSNTLFFEKVRRWNGLLIEADESNYALLKGKHRKAFTMNACLNTESGRVVHGEEARNWIRNRHLKIDEVSVQCFPLYSILLALNQLTVDFFSLDVEGDEMRVLQTIPFDKIDIKMMTVEFIHQSRNGKDLKPFVESKGYDSLLKVTRWDGRVNDIIFRKKGLTH
ncbi:STAR-like protein, partial [Mya arenaria]